MENVAIFIDYDNVYLSLEKNYETFKRCNLKTEIVSIIKEEYKDDKILTFKAFADFERINNSLTKLQKSQVELRHVYSNSNGRKNASDIAMTIDIVKSIYSKNEIDRYVIVSSDSDMLPIINELQYFGKDISVFYSEYSTCSDYKDYIGDENCYTIEKLLQLQKYSPITDSEICNLQNLTNILNTINNGINDIFNRYNRKGTTSKKDVYDFLWSTDLYVSNDISLIIEYLTKKDILIESDINNSSYVKLLLNDKFITDNEINLEKPLVKEEMYKK